MLESANSWLTIFVNKILSIFVKIIAIKRYSFGMEW